MGKSNDNYGDIFDDELLWWEDDDPDWNEKADQWLSMLEGKDQSKQGGSTVYGFPGFGGFGGSGAYASKCSHSGNVLVFDVPIGNGKSRLRVYGGGSSRKADPFEMDLFVDLAGGRLAEELWTFPAWAKRSRELQTTEVANMYIPDRYAPAYTAAMWQAFVNDIKLRAESLGRDYDVLVACVGGHGRTGLALCCIGIELGVLDPVQDPIKKLRDHYCKEAVESNEQFVYLESEYGVVTEEKVHELPKSNYKGAGSLCPEPAPDNSGLCKLVRNHAGDHVNTLGKKWFANKPNK